MNYATIPGFEALTLQQMFDISLAHIRSTRTKSIKPGSTSVCVYSGSGCAASVFLRPERRDEFDAMYAGHSVSWLTLAGTGHVPEHESYFVRELQNCHDRTPNKDGQEAFMAEYERSMSYLAERRGLTYTPEVTTA